jgi:hypothetical protein
MFEDGKLNTRLTLKHFTVPMLIKRDFSLLFFFFFW